MILSSVLFLILVGRYFASDADTDDSEDEDEDSDDEPNTYAFPTLDAQIRQIISSYGAVFPKLNFSSPKVYAYIHHLNPV